MTVQEYLWLNNGAQIIWDLPNFARGPALSRPWRGVFRTPIQAAEYFFESHGSLYPSSLYQGLGELGDLSLLFRGSDD